MSRCERIDASSRATSLVVLAAVALVAVSSSCASFAPTDAPAREVRGPLPTRIQHPLALTLPNLTPRRPVVQPEGSWRLGADVAYSSLFELDSRGGDRVAFDAELLRATAHVRYGVASNVDVEVELAGRYGSGGFLDHFLREYHDLIGAPNQGRDAVDDDQFEAELQYDSVSVYSWRANEAQLADTSIVLTLGADGEAPDEWRHAARFGLELPTGSESDGSSNGGVDWIVGWLAERSHGRFTHHFALNYGRAQRPERFKAADLALPDRASGFYALELRWTDRLSAVAQVDVQSPLIDRIHLEEIDSAIVDLGVGAWFDVAPNQRLWGSFHEDLLAASGPDFALYFGWTWRP